MESKQIKKKVYSLYQSGFHCSEVISRTIMESFSEKVRPEAVRAASAFGGGIAGSTEELCGAFTGGVIALGYLLGRDKPGENLMDCGAVTKEFKGRFLNQFGSLNCRVILEGFNHQDNPLGCVKLTAEASVILADLLRDFEQQKGMGFDSYCCQPRNKKELGACPFSAGSCQSH
ncbi:MAG: C_GCAxxG_C_C family protein [Deltaproteobacteria bacterium]|nr:C_GCAxxG_C_C family protein [Deltaproteobacteria bacterium]